MLRIAHRGASGYETENSLAAFQKAVELNCDIIEADVRLSSDQIPFIFHDEYVDRLTNSTGRFEDFSSNEITEDLRLKNDQKIPELKELCELAKKNGIGLYLDIKSMDKLGIIVKMATQICNPDDLIIASFDHQFVINSKKENPELPHGLILDHPINNIVQTAIENNISKLCMEHSLLDKALVNEIHINGLEILAWTVNTEQNIERMKDLKVAGAITDYPDLV